MRRSAVVVLALYMCAAAAQPGTAHKRFPSPAGTPSPLNAYRNRPTVLSTTPSRGAVVPA